VDGVIQLAKLIVERGADGSFMAGGGVNVHQETS
jgi:hypothetical protein